MTINVSDLYDGLHDIAATSLGLFGLGPDTEPAYDEFLDQLELDLFLPACARRVQMLTRSEIDAEDVASLIRLRERDGSIRAGAAGRYHSHAFDLPGAGGTVENLVLAANMMPRSRAEVELVIVVD